MERRGRPKIPDSVAEDNSRKYQRLFMDDGIETIWTYDLDIFPNGPISTEFKHTKEYLENNKKEFKQEKNGKKIKNTRRTNDVSIENKTSKRGRPRQNR